MKNFVVCAIYGGIAVGLICPSLATAQRSGDAAFTIEEIVVTARKREENLQETPISISAFTGATLERRQINSSNQLAQVTPNLTFDSHAPASGSNAGGQIFIRGIGQSDFQALTDPGVGLYIDGVYYARTVGSVIDFMDVERIEVLRGPQGTLFGRNTIGGAIDITTKRPGDEFSGHAKLALGSKGRVDATVAADLPLSETVSARISVGTRNRDGYVMRLDTGEDLGNDSSWHVRARLAWDPSDTFSLDVIADYNKEDENGQPTVFAGISQTSVFPILASLFAGCPGSAGPPNPVPDAVDPRCANNQFLSNGSFAADPNFPTFSELENWGISATAIWDVGAVSVKSITSYRDLSASASRDADNTSVSVLHSTFDTSDEQFSQEIQISGSAASDRLNWLLGLFYFDQKAADRQDIIVPVGSIVLQGPADIESKAVFAQATYALTDKLNLTAGIRFTDEEKNFLPQTQTTSPTFTFPVPDALTQDPAYIALINSLSPTGTFTAIDIPPPVTNIVLPQGTFLVPPTRQTSSASETTPMINLAYQFNDDFMIYGTYSEGFKGGGINFRFIEVQASAIPFSPENVESIELGFKSEWGGGRARLSGSVFQTDYTDIQIVTVPVLAPLTVNAATGEIKGFELEFTAVPTDNLEIVAAVGNIHTKFNQLGPQVLNNSSISINNNFRQSPEWSFNFGAAYAFEVNDQLSITPRIDWSYRSETFFDAENSPVIAQPSFDILNAQVLVDIREKWQLVLGVTNVTDEAYRVAGFSTLGATSGYAESVFARPREWSLTLRANF